jgi:arylsulfatase A-like enzyme
MAIHLSRRQFLHTAAAGAAVLGVPGIVRCETAAKRKDGINVLFLMTDEQHYRSLSITGNPYIQTPHMDRIAREGVLFENATCVTPYCSPSRASILTGVYPHRHRILTNVGARQPDPHGAAAGTGKEPPLAADAFPNTEMMLFQRGYATAHRGKWHLGDRGDFPCYESWGYACKNDAEYSKILNERLPAAQCTGDGSPGMYLGRPVVKTEAIRQGWQKFQDSHVGVAYIATIGRTVIPPELLPETFITDQVVGLIEKNADRNFMITASWSPPHDLWVIADPYYSMVDRTKVQPRGSTTMPPWDQKGASKQLGDIMGPDGVREYAAVYHGMVKYIDDQVGRILKKLDDLGLAGNTLVIFTTDHGDMAGAHGCIGKSVPGFYDDLVRIPLAMRLPGRIKPGTVVKQPVSQIDYMPTICDYVGVPIPEKIHGRSMRPLIEGRDVPWRDYAFCQRASAWRMLRTEQYKYATGLEKAKIRVLYDLRNDPNEDHNLAADPAHADTVRAMHKRLMEVMTADGDPAVSAMPQDPLA